MDLLIKSGTIVTDSEMFKADVAVKDGKIVAVAEGIRPEDGTKTVDAEGKLVLPGAIDAHTHLAMPFGGTISSDDYYAGTRAAACGGTTTVFDFVLQDFGETMVDAVKRRDKLCRPAAEDIRCGNPDSGKGCYTFHDLQEDGGTGCSGTGLRRGPDPSAGRREDRQGGDKGKPLGDEHGDEKGRRRGKRRVLPQQHIPRQARDNQAQHIRRGSSCHG